jgi:hypothetical protein
MREIVSIHAGDERRARVGQPEVERLYDSGSGSRQDLNSGILKSSGGEDVWRMVGRAVVDDD